MNLQYFRRLKKKSAPAFKCGYGFSCQTNLFGQQCFRFDFLAIHGQEGFFIGGFQTAVFFHGGDFAVDPVQEVGVAFLNGGGDKFGRTEIADGDFKVRVFFRPRPQQGVVVRECYAATVLSKVSVFWSNFNSLTSGWLLVKKASAAVPLLTSRVWSFNCAMSVIGLFLGETTPNATFM